MKVVINNKDPLCRMMNTQKSWYVYIDDVEYKYTVDTYKKRTHLRPSHIAKYYSEYLYTAKDIIELYSIPVVLELDLEHPEIIIDGFYKLMILK